MLFLEYSIKVSNLFVIHLFLYMMCVVNCFRLNFYADWKIELFNYLIYYVNGNETMQMQI